VRVQMTAYRKAYMASVQTKKALAEAQKFKENLQKLVGAVSCYPLPTALRACAASADVLAARRLSTARRSV
jgi:hypothetical protein